MIFVGKCRELYKDEKLPSIVDMVGGNPHKSKDKILQYLKNGKKGAMAAGRAYDIIGNKPIQGEFCCYNDGEYVWRSDTIYYFEKYNLALDSDFVKHILKN